MDPSAVIAGRFVIERKVAAGGMGSVFRAHDRVDGVVTALKILSSDSAVDVERFEREAAILSQLSHPGIVRYVAHGTTGAGERYLAMEWLEGEDLASRLSRRALAPFESVTLLRRAANALAFAHDQGVVHRDIKPSNLFLPGGDVSRLKVVDFGIARPDGDAPPLTLTGGILGTPGYMAPEQIEGTASPDPSADVFALGCVFFECLTGRPVFAGAHAMAAIARLLLQEPPRLRELRPDAPARLDDLIARMLARSPEDRPRDGAEVGAALGQIEGVLEAWLSPGADSTMASSRAGAASNRDRSALTLSEQRLVSLVLAAPSPGQASVPEAELRAALEPYGGQLASLSSGALAVTIAGPGSAVDRAERAAQCALALQAELPGAPVCVMTGRGVIAESAVAGEAVERALLALRVTRPGAVRIDDVTAGMLGGRFTVERGGDVMFLSAEISGEESAPALLGKPTPWVGRSRELSMLEGVFSGCVAESLASAVLVLGPAGSGKSRLRVEFLGKVRKSGTGVDILSGRADSVAAGSPFGMIADVIRRAAGLRDGEPIEVRRRKLKGRLGRCLAGPDLDRVAAFLGELIGTPFPEAEAGAIGAARARAMLMGDAVRASWEDWLAAECAVSPVLLVLEDLHWGDAATVRLIDATLRNLRELPLMILVLARPEVHKQFPSLWADREVQVIKLGPLPRRASEQIVRAALGDTAPAEVVARVLDRADGNPFYLEELIRAVDAGKGDALPDSVLGTVEARLDAEGTEAKRVLRAASVFGDRFSKFGVAALLGGEEHLTATEAWLEALACRELVAPAAGSGFLGPTDYVFRHAIVREAAYAMLTEGDRALGHKLAGDWLERTGHTDAIALAEHFRRGGEPARAVRWYRRAAEQALEASELPVALERAALGVACGATGEELGGLRLVEAEASIWKGDLTGAERQAVAATERFAVGSTGWFRAATQGVAAAGKLGASDRVERWAAQVAAAPASTGAPADPDDGLLAAIRRARIACLGECAIQLSFGGRFPSADALIEQIGAASREPPAPGPDVVALLHQVRALRASAAGDLGTSLENMELALAAFEKAADRRSACVMRANLGFLYFELGDFEAAESALRFALSSAERMGLLELVTVVLHNLGHVLAHLDQIDEAWRLELRAVETFHAHGDLRMEGVARTYLAKIALLSGDPAAAEREARAAAAALQVAPPLRAAAVAVVARALLTQGRPEEALAAATEAFAELEALGTLEEGESLVRLAHVEALAAAGDAAAAARALAAARESLLARAAKISDPRRREQFLAGVPENARLLAPAP